MIVHSTANNLGDTCTVRIEGIEPGLPEALVKLFAQGAAAKHNAGYDVSTSGLVWADAFGRPIPDGDDTSIATCALVACKVVAP